jgi:protein TonB
MFEQSVLEARVLTARPLSLAMSLAGQAFLITAAVLLPLVHPDVLQRAAFWIPVTGPPPAYHAPAPAILDVVRSAAAPRVFVGRGLVEPSRIPETITLLQDSMPEVGSGAVGPATGVPGGFGPPGAASGVMNSITILPPPVVPAPVQTAVKDVPKQVTISRLTIGGNVQAAKLILAPQPVYPPLAKQARIQGVVRIGALIGTDGKIASLRIMSGHPLLVGTAMDAVKRWVYRPTLLNGDPVEAVTEITVTFTLN